MVVRKHGAPACDRPACEAAVGGELEAHNAFAKPVDSRAAEQAGVGVVEVAIDCVRVEQRRDLVDEPLQDRFELELARHGLSGLQQCRLLA